MRAREDLVFYAIKGSDRERPSCPLDPEFDSMLTSINLASRAVRSAGLSWRLPVLTIATAFPRFKAMRLFIICDAEGRVVHRALVMPRFFRTRFMMANDVMIGSLWTEPTLRGRGLARHAVSRILELLAGDGFDGTAWYVVHKSNISSIGVAEACGLTPRAVGHRTTPGGSDIFGRFVMDSLEMAEGVATSGQFDYTSVTEGWNTLGNREQRAMASLRYELLRRLAEDKRMLEVACGTGYGFAHASKSAAFATAGDLMATNVRTARSFLSEAPIAQFRSDRLPFRANSFDVVGCLEALYYFLDLPRFLEEVSRVLAPGGQLLMTWPNSDRPSFIESPGAVAYPSPEDLARLAGALGLKFQAWGSFPWNDSGPMAIGTECLRRVASKLHLIPDSLAGRARLKRLLFLDMKPLADLDRTVDIERVLIPVDISAPGRFKSFIAICHKPMTS